MAKYTQTGEEVLDTTPVALPIRFKAPLPLNERIRQMVRQEASQYAQQTGHETFEEADDFDIPDDMPDPTTPYEENFDPDVPFIAAREAEIRHGAVEDFKEETIERGLQEAQKYKKPQKEKTSRNEMNEQSQSNSESLTVDKVRQEIQ